LEFEAARQEADKQQKEAVTAEPVEVPAEDFEESDFVASARFEGSRSGFYFGTGEHGTGYYRDMRRGKTSSSGYPKEAAPKTADAPRASNAGHEASGHDDELVIPAGSIMLGLVGHPNVGKSSLVNSLMGNKVVSVKATPGHTKTLQTLNLDDKTCLCDSPGVVFPRLEVPREAQIVGMLVPLAQVREPFSAIRWVMERSVKPLHEVLGLKPVTLKRIWELQEAGLESLRLDLVDADSHSDEVPWSPMLLCAQLAAQRGFVQGGRPDCMKAGTEILERVLQGRVPYCVPAPADTELPQASAKVLEQDDSGSDWQACDDEDYESEESDEEIGDRDLMEIFGQEARGIGRGSKSSVKRFKRRQKLAELAGEADPARTMRPYAGRLQDVGNDG